MGGCGCDQWEAQWQLSCMITAIFYGSQIDKEDRKGTQSGSVKEQSYEEMLVEGRDGFKKECRKGQRGSVKGGLVI